MISWSRSKNFPQLNAINAPIFCLNIGDDDQFVAIANPAQF